MDIITGEKIQKMCDIYLGMDNDFLFNPVIKNESHKHMDLNHIIMPFDNPRIIFCYSNRIQILSQKIGFFMNPFILVTHNSDQDVVDNYISQNILNCKNLELWYTQNPCFEHEKMVFLPIGIANSQWDHGNLSLFENDDFMKNIVKTKMVYFYFSIHTNPAKREKCYNSLIHRIEWLDSVSPIENFMRLKNYEFCICPEGNGVDTHRLWEAIYVKTVPIVIKSKFTDILIKNNLPLVVIDDWSDLNIEKLNYQDYNFADSFYPSFIRLRNRILGI